mmetsp:Transcript_134987/g.262867  ORF Transcript_134987/g.262867 Transcript_134987/m.262867 type:complete len:202 (-) Transcript_134987:420-1025(-)
MCTPRKTNLVGHKSWSRTVSPIRWCVMIEKAWRQSLIGSASFQKTCAPCHPCTNHQLVIHGTVMWSTSLRSNHMIRGTFCVAASPVTAHSCGASSTQVLSLSIWRVGARLSLSAELVLVASQWVSLRLRHGAWNVSFLQTQRILRAVRWWNRKLARSGSRTVPSKQHRRSATSIMLRTCPSLFLPTGGVSQVGPGTCTAPF